MDTRMALMTEMLEGFDEIVDDLSEQHRMFWGIKDELLILVDKRKLNANDRANYETIMDDFAKNIVALNNIIEYLKAHLRELNREFGYVKSTLEEGD